MNVGSPEEAAILHAGNHPTRANQMECLGCGEHMTLSMPMEMGRFGKAMMAFLKLHRACQPKGKAQLATMERRFWLATRRSYGSSADAMADFAEGRLPTAAAVVERAEPQDGDDLAACYRRRNTYLDGGAAQARCDEVLALFAAEAPDAQRTRDFVMVAEPVIALLLWLDGALDGWRRR